MADLDLINEQFRDFGSMRPTWRAYLVHFGLLLITLFTATIAGVLYPFGRIPIFPEADPETFQELLQFVGSLPARYFELIGYAVAQLATDQATLVEGLSFSISLLFILFCHEMGHYVACRLYRVDATLPFFLPTPPLVGPAGTFGAFIKIQSQ